MSQCIIPEEYSSTIDPADVLQDVNAKGKPRPWVLHKLEAQATAIALAWGGQPVLADRVGKCADVLWFRKVDGKPKLQKGTFCRVRICPICQWRRSLKLGGQVRACTDWIQDQQRAAGRNPYRFALLTLTVPNVPADQLGETLDKLSKAWDRMSKRAEFKRAVKGYVRATEITYNQTRQDFHPHLHVLLMVQRSYFTSRLYISQARWLELWRAATGDPTITEVWVSRTAKEAENAPEEAQKAVLGHAIAEVTKYTTKPSAYLRGGLDLDTQAQVITQLQTICTGRRFVSLGGLYRKAAQALALDDPETGDLVHCTDPLAGESDAGAELWPYTWYPGPRLYLTHHRR